MRKSVYENFRRLCQAFVSATCWYLLTADACRADPAQAFRYSLSKGKAITVIVAPPPSANDLRDEAYGDWAAYLNDFSVDEANNFSFIKVTQAGLRSLLLPKVEFRTRYATIFVKDASHAILYDGMILDAIIYSRAAQFLKGHAEEVPNLPFGLKQFRFSLPPSRLDQRK